MLDLLEENIFGTNDKAIIVSQWTSVLSMFSFFLDQKKVSYCSITGGVPVNLRNEIVMDFNNAESKTKVQYFYIYPNITKKKRFLTFCLIVFINR